MAGEVPPASKSLPSPAPSQRTVCALRLRRWFFPVYRRPSLERRIVMLFSSWLRNWKRPVSHLHSHRLAGFRPRLEALEDRQTPSSAIVQTNLVSDDIQFTPAQIQDPNLVNPWGLTPNPNGAWWVANEGTGTSTLYNTSASTTSIVPL